MSILLQEYPEDILKRNIFKPFKYDEFNAKDHITENGKKDIDEAVRHVGCLLQKHGLSDIVGVYRVHNHFHLKQNELVLSKIIENDSKLLDSDAKYMVHMKAVNVLNDSIETPIPYMWAFDKETKMFSAIQFFDSSVTKMVNRFHEMCKRIENLTTFYQEFVDFIDKNEEMSNHLGIVLLHDDLCQINNGQALLEITDEAEREQWIFPEATQKVEERVANCKCKTYHPITTTLYDFSKETPQNIWCGVC